MWTGGANTHKNIWIRILIQIWNLKSSVSDPDWIRVQSGQRILILNPDPDPGGQKLPKKIEKVKKFHVLKCWMFSFEG
jgi:hypothetical protein